MSSVLRLCMLHHHQPLRIMGTRMLTSERVGFAPIRSHELKDPVPPALLSFKDPRAFQSKSWWELIRALGVFRLCSYPVLVNNCGKVSVANLRYDSHFFPFHTVWCSQQKMVVADAHWIIMEAKVQQLLFE